MIAKSKYYECRIVWVSSLKTVIVLHYPDAKEYAVMMNGNATWVKTAKAVVSIVCTLVSGDDCNSIVETMDKE